MSNDKATAVIPFGKHKGRPVEELLESDPGYLEWLAGQDWFRVKYVTLHQTIINRGGEPEETPEHNALQVRFLQEEFCLNFMRCVIDDLDDYVTKILTRRRDQNIELVLKNLSEKEREMAAHAARTANRMELPAWYKSQQETFEAELVRLRNVHTRLQNPIRTEYEAWAAFEVKGIDVELSASAWSEGHTFNEKERVWDWKEIWWEHTWNIEIKPSVGDDYPAVLRQMKANKSKVLFVERYAGTGATENQFIKTFETEGMTVVFLRDVPR